MTGWIGGDEPGVPAYWRMSVEIASAWEQALAAAHTPATRKVALRTAMVMSAEPGGVFELLARLTRCGLGGSLAGGQQFMAALRAAWRVPVGLPVTRGMTELGAFVPRTDRHN